MPGTQGGRRPGGAAVAGAGFAGNGAAGAGAAEAVGLVIAEVAGRIRPLQEIIAAAFDIQCVYRPEIKQATVVVTITDTTPGIITALTADPRTDHDNGARHQHHNA
jgi:hypothetical protein